MSTKKKGRIGKFLEKADEAIKEGIKKADEGLEDAVKFGETTASKAKKTGGSLKDKIEKEGLTTKGLQKLSKSTRPFKNLSHSVKDDLETLEKLGDLRKIGTITEKEFQEKKKEILERI